MSKSIKDNSNCSGCGVCSAVCPKNAISFITDAKGFNRPMVSDNCINCGLCVKRCHEHEIFTGRRIIKAFTAYTDNLEIRNVSSSGGVFSEIAIQVIKNGGFVCGASFDENLVLCHQIVEKIEDLEGLRKSKYLESDMTLIWKELKERVVTNKQSGLFVGTPCQCAAVRLFLGVYADNMLICDFICHGVASPVVFEKYKAHLKEQYGAPKKIEFRHKENGEGSYFYYEGGDGKYMVPNYTKSYPYAYASGLIIADDCTNCKYCKLERFSDITLGDYVSGPTDYTKSTIFTNTQKGFDFFHQCTDLMIIEEDLQDIIAKSWHLTMPNTHNPKRVKVFEQLDKPWEYLEQMYFHAPRKFELYKQTIVNKIKRIIHI